MLQISQRRPSCSRDGERPRSVQQGDPDLSSISARKAEHLDVVSTGRGTQDIVPTGFDSVRFEHVALPELDLDGVSTETEFIGRGVSAPLMVSAMTGGAAEAERINRHIAEACGALRLAFSVGSQRVAMDGSNATGLTRALRDAAGEVPIVANLGAVQLSCGFGRAEAERAVDMIGADALVLHLNPLQEAIQANGDTAFADLLTRIEALARDLSVPVGIKEVGAGLSARVARRLSEAGVTLIDVAGVGGTSWARVEAERGDDRLRRLAAPFHDWGIPTARCLVTVRAELGAAATIVGSGGIRHGLDVARALRIGADMTGQAAGVLEVARNSVDALVDHLSLTIEQLRIAMFCTGSGTLAALRQARLMRGPDDGAGSP